MMKKTLVALGLLAVTTLSGCVVYGPPRPVVYAPGPAYYGPAYPYYGPTVVVGPVVPAYGFYGGWHGRWR
jgi:hypothetical protein